MDKIFDRSQLTVIADIENQPNCILVWAPAYTDAHTGVMEVLDRFSAANWNQATVEGGLLRATSLDEAGNPDFLLVVTSMACAMASDAVKATAAIFELLGLGTLDEVYKLISRPDVTSYCFAHGILVDKVNAT